MSKKSQEILYDSEVENVETNEVVEVVAVAQPQIIPIVAPIPIRAPKSQTPVKVDEIKESFKCAYCDKQFVRNYYLNRHVEDGRCPVIRNIAKAKEKQLKDLEDKINQKLHKKDLREEKKQMKALTTPVKEKPVKPVKAVKPVKQVQPVPAVQPVQQYQQRPKNGYIVNF